MQERVQLPKAPVAVAAPAAATTNGHPPASELEGKERKEALKRQLLEDVNLYLTSLGQVSRSDVFVLDVACVSCCDCWMHGIPSSFGRS